MIDKKTCTVQKTFVVKKSSSKSITYKIDKGILHIALSRFINVDDIYTIPTEEETVLAVMIDVVENGEMVSKNVGEYMQGGPCVEISNIFSDGTDYEVTY